MTRMVYSQEGAASRASVFKWTFLFGPEWFRVSGPVSGHPNALGCGEIQGGLKAHLETRVMDLKGLT